MNHDRIILAQGCTYSCDSTQTGLNNNQIIVGGSGSGKTMSITEPCLLNTHHRNLIVTATKARIVHKYKPLLEDRGYRVEILDFSNLQNCTVGYDPLKFVRTQEDVTFLARSIIMADPRKKGNTHMDPYWDEAAISLLSALIGLVQLRDGEHRPSFADVVRQCQRLRVNYSSSNIRTNLDLDFQGLEFRQPGNPASANWESFCHLPPRTAACVTGMLNTSISHLFNAELLDMMGLPMQVDIQQLAQEKTVLFVITSPVNPALSSLVSLFYATAMKELFEFAERRGGGLPIPVHMICDDFATGAPIPDFAQYISIMREAGLSVTLLCQSESQLESVYSPAEATTIINNCDSYVFTGGMDLQTARNVSLRLNMPVDEVLSMPLGTFAVFRRGAVPVLAQRYPILDDPEHQRLMQRLMEPETHEPLPVELSA